MALELCRGLLDINYGQWQGLPQSEVRQGKHGLLGPLWFENPEGVQISGGESLQIVRQRAAGALEKAVARHKDEEVVFVSHEVVCRALLSHVVGLDGSCFWRIGQSLCAINVIEQRRSGLAVTLLSDACHLG